MKQHHLIALFLALSISLTVRVPTVSAAQMTVDDYWNEVNFKFDMVTNSYTTAFCYQKKIAFLSCVAAANGALAFFSKPVQLAPSSRITANSGFGNVEEDFGLLKIVGRKTTEERSLAKRLLMNNEERAVNQKALIELYDRNKDLGQVDFGKIFSWIETRIVKTSKRKPTITAQTLNAFIASAKDPHSYLVPTRFMKDRMNLNSANPLGLGMTAEEAPAQNVTTRLLRSGKRVFGYVRLGEFKKQSCTDVRKAIAELSVNADTHEMIDGYIFDLRGNVGGLIDQAICIGSTWVGPNRVIVDERFLDSRKADLILKGQHSQMTALPMVTLINAQSASASEIVSGVLQGYQRSLIVGVRSFGKGSMQRLDPLPSNAAASYAHTIGRFWLPGDLTASKELERTNQGGGIVPNLEVYTTPAPTEDEKAFAREDDRYINALPTLSPPYVEPRPELMTSIRKCIEANGEAKKTYESILAAFIPVDYQLLYAEDALNCSL